LPLLSLLGFHSIQGSTGRSRQEDHLSYRAHLAIPLASFFCALSAMASGGRGGGAVGRMMAVLGLALALAAAARVAAAGHDYRQALSKSILYFEAQRSGRLPDGGQRVAWRANSGLLDGKANGVSCHDVRVGVALRAHGSKKSSNLVSFFFFKKRCQI
jgi:hypothetical protein